MVSDKSLALLISFSWLIGLAAVFFWGLPILRRRYSFTGATSVQLVLLTCFVRLVPLLILPVGADYDIESFRLVGDSVTSGVDVYTSTQVAGRHPYLPLQLYVIGGMTALSLATKVPFVVLVKVPGVLADVVICLMIFRAVRHIGGSTNTAGSMATLYAFNPVAILVSTYHGQFDALPAALIMAAWYVWRFKPPEYAWLSALLLGLAILNKTWPALFLPIMLLQVRGTRMRMVYLTLALAVPVLGTLIYVLAWNVPPGPLLGRSLTHSGVPGWWGLGAILNILESIAGWGGALLNSLILPNRYIIFVVVGLSYLFTRHQDPLDSFVTGLLLLYVVTLGFGLQWLVWVIPFAALLNDRHGFKLFTLGAMLHLIISLFGLHMNAVIPQTFGPTEAQLILRIGSIPAWGAALVWVVARLRNSRRMKGTLVTAQTGLSN